MGDEIIDTSGSYLLFHPYSVSFICFRSQKKKKKRGCGKDEDVQVDVLYLSNSRLS